MNRIVFDAGPLVIRTYTAWLGGGILLALLIIVWRAYRYHPSAVTRWQDVALAAILGGVVGARLLHVALEWDYFRDHQSEIAKISLGGLAWHGTLLAGIPAALLAAWIRRVPLRPFTDAVALAWPIGLMAAWYACRKVGSGYGYEVRTLADWPEWAVEELPDVYGVFAPRLDVQAAGILLGLILFVLALVLTWRGWLPGMRLWLVFGLTGLIHHLLGYFRADPAQALLDRRADQVFDLLLLLLSTFIGCGLALWSRQKGTVDENQPGFSADHAQTG
ncbi:MAG TPA: prolipoprotein diacylglyceryl transferase family protein [Aggregatilineaceae bacterium]|nr:prolipoprotein diacylglyceryl transferase family protein [Aggregatilineaceae bacterium]